MPHTRRLPNMNSRLSTAVAVLRAAVRVQRETPPFTSRAFHELQYIRWHANCRAARQRNLRESDDPMPCIFVRIADPAPPKRSVTRHAQHRARKNIAAARYAAAVMPRAIFAVVRECAMPSRHAFTLPSFGAHATRRFAAFTPFRVVEGSRRFFTPVTTRRYDTPRQRALSPPFSPP